MARTSMAELISRIRLLINDPGGVSQVYSDDSIEDALDTHREDVRYLELQAAATLSPAGVPYLTYYADRAPWEADEVLVSGSWQTVTPATADHLVGRWTFAASQPPPVYVVGKVYDVHAAAADLLDMWAAREVLAFDASVDGQDMKRSQKQAQLRALAADLRRQARPRLVRLERDDVT